MLRLLLVVCVAACASASVVGVERVRAVPGGPVVLAAANAMWGYFLAAIEPRFADVLKFQQIRTQGQHRGGVSGPPAYDNQIRYTPTWRPDDKQFVIDYVLRRTTTVQWGIESRCGKYDHLRRSPAPCPPPIPTFVSESFVAEASMTVIYDREGRFVNERLSTPRAVRSAPRRASP